MKQTVHKLLTFGIAAVWLVNGLFFKILNLMPRHEVIVARIVSETHSRLFIVLIGSLECLMVVWVLSGIKSRACAIFQVCVIMAMNIMEFLLVPDILMFGRVNLLVAIGFCIIILFNEFYLNRRMEPAKS